MGTNRPFKVLHLISNTIEVVGFILLGLSLGIPLMLLLIGQAEDLIIKAGIGFLIAIFSLLIICSAQVIRVFLQIEENTRRIGAK
jgi:predicted membrane protein